MANVTTTKSKKCQTAENKRLHPIENIKSNKFVLESIVNPMTPGAHKKPQERSFKIKDLIQGEKLL